MDDKGLRRTIVDTLDREPNIDAARIGVAVENGVAILTGHLCSHTEKVAAEQAVRRVRGVRAVMSAIAVRDPGRKASDDEIARRTLVVIAWHVHTPEGAVTVQVHNGWVTLTGAVEDAYERREAEAAVRTLDGVAGVTNLIETRMSAAAPILGRRIEKMPDRPAGIETEANWVTGDYGTGVRPRANTVEYRIGLR